MKAIAIAAPRVLPPLDPAFQPLVLADRAFEAAARAVAGAVEIRLALEQGADAVFHFSAHVFPESDARAAFNFAHLQRRMRFVLWSRGAPLVHIRGPKPLVAALQRHFCAPPTAGFDAEMMGARIYDRAFEVRWAAELPAARARAQRLGGHLQGCRIGFDLGGSDRKCAAVIDGRCVFSDEVPWDPIPQRDPQYHFDGIMDSLRRAASHLPRVDAIGGSAAGVYVGNRVRVASLFRSVPAALFQQRVRDLFFEVQRAWNGVPLEVVNDGEVTALAGSIRLRAPSVLGLAMGTSMAAGYVNRAGQITTWLNELAFAPVDANPAAPIDEWSHARGCGVQYFSQQGIGRLVSAAGISVAAKTPLPEVLEQVQALSARGDERAARIYATVGVYLGYALAQYAGFYDFDHVLVLGRVTSGPGGAQICDAARRVLDVEFPELAARVRLHLPDETEKRHGQAIAAASLTPLTPAAAIDAQHPV